MRLLFALFFLLAVGVAPGQSVFPVAKPRRVLLRVVDQKTDGWGYINFGGIFAGAGESGVSKERASELAGRAYKVAVKGTGYPALPCECVLTNVQECEAVLFQCSSGSVVRFSLVG